MTGSKRGHGRTFRSFWTGIDSNGRDAPDWCCASLQTNVNFAFALVRALREGSEQRRMFGILGLGFLLGMQHALEADHVAAVSSIAARRSEVADIVKHGLTWGLGHTLTLFVFAGAAILLGEAMPEHLTQPLETAVGIMLVGLGAHVLWRLWRDRVHFHRHSHGDGTIHIHAHSHAGEAAPHARSQHGHGHGFRWRTLLVGLMHGMAGSAALLVLTVSQAQSPAAGLAYVALFGIGSMIGMGALSTLIAVPIAISARWLTFANRGLQGAVGIVTIAIGVHTIVSTAFA
jgi:cytochrome c biogenesis protein CcdA